MLTIAEKIAFIMFAGVSLYFGGKGFYDVYRVISRGKADTRFDNLGARIRRAVGIVLTQRSVFKTRPVVSLLHALVFYGFVYYFLVNLIDLLEGFFAFHTRGGGWNAFNLLADLLTTGILMGVAGLILRRRIVQPK
ncbi:MAG: [Fe-S]-binding protein, partial [Deltaproteobacteria bacterium]|nr:[Fe-S]-binding protein [Deltaproteobacteria bacterium]